jgi:hypothetical protein
MKRIGITKKMKINPRNVSSIRGQKLNPENGKWAPSEEDHEPFRNCFR